MHWKVTGLAARSAATAVIAISLVAGAALFDENRASGAPARSDADSPASQVKVLQQTDFADGGADFAEANPADTATYNVTLHHGAASDRYGNHFVMRGRPVVSRNLYGSPGALVLLQDRRPRHSSPAYLYQLWLFRDINGTVVWNSVGIDSDPTSNRLDRQRVAWAAPVVAPHHRGGFAWRLTSSSKARYRTVFSLQHQSSYDLLNDLGTHAG